jgi:hypothetical protein
MANSPCSGILNGMIYSRGKAPIRSGRTAGIAISVILHASFAAAQPIPGINARLVAVNIPGASAIAQIGQFLNEAPSTGQCSHPIPSNFPTYIQHGAVLDPKRLLVGSTSNFGAPVAAGGAAPGSFLSIDPSGPGTLGVPSNFAASGKQASALRGAIQMFSANSPNWLNGINNPKANTKGFAGVSNPLGLSNNNGFGRLWPANAPFGLEAEGAEGSSTILDPTGLPLAGAPNQLIGGVYAGDLTDRNVVVPPQPQVIPGGLETGAVGTALLGPSLDGTCKAVFAVVTADGAIVQEHTVKGLDGLAPARTVDPIIGGDSNTAVSPRFGTIMNPYTTQEQQEQGVIRQLFTSEPFSNTIAVLDLMSFGTSPNQVFGPGTLSRITSTALNRPVDLTPVQRDQDDVNWASNTTLDQGSDFYVANQGDNTIVRMQQNGTVAAIRKVMLDDQPLDNVVLNGIAASIDATDTTPPSTIYATFVDPKTGHGGVLAMPGF